MECLIPILLKMFANWFVATPEVLLQLELKPFQFDDILVLPTERVPNRTLELLPPRLLSTSPF